MSVIRYLQGYSFVLLVLLSSPMLAQSDKIHPITGELLAQKQVFTYNLGSEPVSIDPQLTEDVIGFEIARDLFEGLLTQNEDGTLAPGVAKKWESNADKSIYTFHLRKNAVWSNGDPVTAHDFVYAWRRLAEPETASIYAGYLVSMTVKNSAEVISGNKPATELGVSAPDSYTFRVELEGSLLYLPEMVVLSPVFPTPQKVIEKYGNDWIKPEHFVGNGAFVLTEHTINERLILERNPRYWNNEQTIIDKVISLVINDINQALLRYRANELDLTGIPVGQYKRLKRELPDETFSNPAFCSNYLVFNTQRKPFDDKRVRRAFSYAVNRDVITSNILKNGQIPTYFFVPKATNNFKAPAHPANHLTQEERKSKSFQLMQEAGFDRANPLKMTFLYNTSDGYKKIAIAMQQMWKAIGVDSVLENKEWKIFVSSLHQGEFDVARGWWCGDYNEASTFLSILGSEADYNSSRYGNSEIDRLLASARTMDDPSPNYMQIEEIIAEEVPIAPLYHSVSSVMLKPWVKGWPHQNLQNNWYSKNLYIVKH